jgi:hypothetical protein
MYNLIRLLGLLAAAAGILGISLACVTVTSTVSSPPFSMAPVFTPLSPTPVPSVTFSALPGLLLPTSSAAVQSSAPSPTIKAEGKLLRAGKFKVLVLQGDFYQMGRQYGGFLKEDLTRLYPAVVDSYLIGEHKLSLKQIKSWVDPRYALYPDTVKKFIDGTAESSGIEKEKLIILSDLTDLTRITPDGGGCSGIAVWGPYTAGGPLIFGRNFDWWGGYKDFNPYITVTVFNPAGGNSFASVSWAGELLLQTGLNSAGVFLESNDGEISAGAAFRDDIVHPSILAISLLSRSDNLEQLDSLVNSNRIGRAMTLSVADKNKAYAYECTPDTIKSRPGEAEGILVATNHFVEPSWTGLRPPRDDNQTETRRNNLLVLAEKYKGSLTVGTMQQLLDLPIDRGGATQPNTLYQVIAVPGQFKLWIKAPGFSDWTEIDLKPLFTGAR